MFMMVWNLLFEKTRAVDTSPSGFLRTLNGVLNELRLQLLLIFLWYF